jgi:hypothetical protein
MGHLPVRKLVNSRIHIIIKKSAHPHPRNEDEAEPEDDLVFQR